MRHTLSFAARALLRKQKISTSKASIPRSMTTAPLWRRCVHAPSSSRRIQCSGIFVGRRHLRITVDSLSQRKFDRTSSDLRNNILQFYSGLSADETKKNQSLAGSANCAGPTEVDRAGAVCREYSCPVNAPGERGNYLRSLRLHEISTIKFRTQSSASAGIR